MNKKLHYDIHPLPNDQLSVRVQSENNLDVQIVGLQIAFQMFKEMANNVPSGMENYAGALMTAKDVAEKVLFEASKTYLAKHTTT